MIKNNIFSLITALVIIFLSLTGSETFSRVNIPAIKNLDKVVHALMYFTFMLVLLYENRFNINNKRRLLIIAIIPVIFGILIEILQSWITVTRTGNIFDAVFNTIGIFLALLVWHLFHPYRKL